MHKKSFVISILASLALVCFFCSLYIDYKPITLKFDLLSSQDVKLKLFYTTRDKYRFDDAHSIELFVGASSEYQNVSFEINEKRLAKFKLGMQGLPIKVSLKDLSVVGGEILQIHPDMFKVELADCNVVEGETLILSFINNFSYIIVDGGVKFVAGYEIDYCMLFSIFILLLLSFYKIFSYLAKFKLLEKNSRIDIVFLCAFFVLLSLPALNINDANVSEKENRRLKEYSPLFLNGKLNQVFGEEFEEWFNDRFWGRDKIIREYNNLEYKLNNNMENAKAVMGNDNWLFSKHYGAVEMFKNNNLFTDNDLTIIKFNIEKLNDYARASGRIIYVDLNPDKESVYSEYYPKRIKKVNELSRYNQLRQSVKNYSNVKFIFSYDNVLKAKSNGRTAFCKTGTHQTGYGGYLMYEALVNEIVKDFPSIKPFKENDFDIKIIDECDVDIYNSLNLNEDSYPSINMRSEHFDLKKSNVNILSSDYMLNEDWVRVYENKKSSSGLKLFMITDSFMNMYSYTTENFNKTYWVAVGDGRNFELKLFEKQIDTFNPDVIIISSCERFLQRLLAITPPDF